MKRYGPISPYDVETLKTILEERGLPYEIFVGEEDFAAMEERRLSRPPSRHPAPHDPGRYLYVDLDDTSYEAVKTELDKMATGVSTSTGEEEMVDEFHCTECDYTASLPGSCPKHNRPLLEYVQWSQVKTAQQEKSTSGLSAIMGLLFAIILGALYFFLK